MKSFKQFAEDGAAAVATSTGGVSGAGDNPTKTVPVSKKMQKKYTIGEQNDPDTQQQSEKSKMSSDVRQRKNAGLVRTQTVQKHTLDRRAEVLGPHSETPAVKAPSSGVSNRVGPQNPRKLTGVINMESFAQFNKNKVKATAVVAPQIFTTKEEVELDEAAKSGNLTYGYHGTINADDDADRSKKYSAAHNQAKRLLNAYGHLQDARRPNVMVKHFLDSTHGRHIADIHNYNSRPDAANKEILSRFAHFKKKYDPKDFREETSVVEDTLRAQKEITTSNSKTDENPTGFAKNGKDRFLTIGNQVLNKQKEKR